MKTFFITLTVITGLFEKNTQQLIKAPDAKTAGDYAIYCEAHDPKGLDWVDHPRGVVDMSYQFLYAVSSVKEVPEQEIEVLKQYIPVHEYDSEELEGSGNYLKYLEE